MNERINFQIVDITNRSAHSKPCFRCETPSVECDTQLWNGNYAAPAHGHCCDAAPLRSINQPRPTLRVGSAALSTERCSRSLGGGHFSLEVVHLTTSPHFFCLRRATVVMVAAQPALLTTAAAPSTFVFASFVQSQPLRSLWQNCDCFKLGQPSDGATLREVVGGDLAAVCHMGRAAVPTAG